MVAYELKYRKVTLNKKIKLSMRWLKNSQNSYSPTKVKINGLLLLIFLLLVELVIKGNLLKNIILSIGEVKEIPTLEEFLIMITKQGQINYEDLARGHKFMDQCFVLLLKVRTTFKNILFRN